MSHPFIPVPNTASVELIWSFNGVVMENVFHVKKASPYSLADLQALRALVITWDAANFFNVRSGSCTLNRVRTKALDTNTSPTEDYNLPVPKPGSGAGTPLPGNSTFCFKLVTGRSGRSYRGRWYLCGMHTGLLGTTANQFLVSSANYALTQFADLIVRLTAASQTLVVVSYRQNKAWLLVGVPTAVLNFTVVDYNLDSMRKRLTGRGT